MALTSRFPAPGGRSLFRIVGREAPTPEEHPNVNSAEISDGYFRGIAVLALRSD